MWSWLSKIDPNIVIPFITGAGAWLWHKLSGSKGDAMSKLVAMVFQNFGEELLDRYNQEDVTAYLKTARTYIESRMWAVLAKRGVKKNATTDKLVHRALEEATAWLASEIRKAKKK